MPAFCPEKGKARSPKKLGLLLGFFASALHVLSLLWRFSERVERATLTKLAEKLVLSLARGKYTERAGLDNNYCARGSYLNLPTGLYTFLLVAAVLPKSIYSFKAARRQQEDPGRKVAENHQGESERSMSWNQEAIPDLWLPENHEAPVSY